MFRGGPPPDANGISKREVFEALERGGYIEKDAAQNGFYCDAKNCRKALDTAFKPEHTGPGKFGYDVPATRLALWNLMQLASSISTGGVIDPVPAARRRCYVCIYRAYRTVYHRKYGTYPDEDVPNDFDSTSPKPPEVKLTPKRSPAGAQPQYAGETDEFVRRYQEYTRQEAERKARQVPTDLYEQLMLVNARLPEPYYPNNGEQSGPVMVQAGLAAFINLDRRLLENLPLTRVVIVMANKNLMLRIPPKVMSESRWRFSAICEEKSISFDFYKGVQVSLPRW